MKRCRFAARFATLSYLKKAGTSDDTRSEVALTAHGVGDFNVGAPVSASLGSPFLYARKEAHRLGGGSAEPWRRRHAPAAPSTAGAPTFENQAAAGERRYQPSTGASLRRTFVVTYPPCMSVCEPGALRPLGRRNVSMGVTVLEREKCYVAPSQPCDYCFSRHPLNDSAIARTNSGLPVIIEAGV